MVGVSASWHGHWNDIHASCPAARLGSPLEKDQQACESKWLTIALSILIVFSVSFLPLAQLRQAGLPQLSTLGETLAQLGHRDHRSVAFSVLATPGGSITSGKSGSICVELEQ